MTTLFGDQKTMTPAEQDAFVLRAYAEAPEDSVTVYDLIASMSRIAERENILYIPLESRRERATTRLRKAGLIRRSGRGWVVTPAGHAELGK